jgi:hypothetical protein
VSDQLFVPADFAVPGGLMTGEFRLEPLGLQHNTADYAAWTASIGHIRAMPGFAGAGWPHQMSLAENLRDLERHAQDFIARRGFTYTVLGTATGEVIGWVYSYRRAATARTILRRADGMRPSVPGYARTTRRLTRCSTTRSVPGWTATGRSARSSTRHGIDLAPPARPACYLPGGGIPGWRSGAAPATEPPRIHAV